MPTTLPPHPALLVLPNYSSINLTSYYANGTGVITPVWFVIVADKLYVRSEFNTYKVKRIQQNCRIEITPSAMNGQPLGPSFPANARILPEQGDVILKKQVVKAFGRKYGLIYRLVGWLKALTPDTRVFIEIQLEELKKSRHSRR